jgi:hypothetical protein
MSDKRELIEIGRNGKMWALKQILEIEEDHCYYCHERITEGDEFNIFNKPIRLICDSPLCMCEAIEEDERNGITWEDQA